MKVISISFDNLAERLFDYLCSMYQPSQRFPYPLQRGQKGSFWGSVFATFIAFMLGRINELPGREVLTDEMLKLIEDDTGIITDPEVLPTCFLNPDTHSDFYVTMQTTYFGYCALFALGMPSAPKISWLQSLLQGKSVSRWLDALDWQNPWLVSNIDMFLGAFLLFFNDLHGPNDWVLATIEDYFSWHDNKQNKKTGFWGEQEDILNAMAGAYHILTLYDYAGREIHLVEPMIDAIISLGQKDGLFVHGGGGGSCEDMDAIDLLVRLSLRSSHRETEVKETLLRAALVLSTSQKNDGGFCWRIQPSLNGISHVKKIFTNPSLFLGLIYRAANMLRFPSHYKSTHYYSSLSIYPFEISKSDVWSSWFRALSLVFIAKRFPHNFTDECRWMFPRWPGLGYDPFVR